MLPTTELIATDQTRLLPSSIITEILSYHLRENMSGEDEECEPVKLYCYKIGDSDRTPFCAYTSIVINDLAYNYFCYCDVRYMEIMFVITKFDFALYWKRMAALEQKGRRFVPRVIHFGHYTQEPIPALPPNNKVKFQLIVENEQNMAVFAKKNRNFIMSPNLKSAFFDLEPKKASQECNIGDPELLQVVKSKFSASVILNSQEKPRYKMNLAIAPFVKKLYLSNEVEISDHIFDVLCAVAPSVQELEIKEVRGSWEQRPPIRFEKLKQVQLNCRSNDIHPYLSMFDGDNQHVRQFMISNLYNREQISEIMKHFAHVEHLQLSYRIGYESEHKYKIEEIMEFVCQCEKIGSVEVRVYGDLVKRTLNLVPNYPIDKSLKVTVCTLNNTDSFRDIHKQLIDMLMLCQQRVHHSVGVEMDTDFAEYLWDQAMKEFSQKQKEQERVQ